MTKRASVPHPFPWFLGTLLVLAAGCTSPGPSDATESRAAPSGSMTPVLQPAQRIRQVQSAAAGNPVYAVRPDNGALVADNPGHFAAVRFDGSGPTVKGPDWSLGLRSVAVGRPDQLAVLPTVDPASQANRVEYRRGDLVEWYENGPLGLEQGYVVPESPAGDGPLVIELAVDGLTPTAQNGHEVVFAGPEGRQLVYRDLVATDHEGRAIPASFELAGSVVRLRLDDRLARYPVLIDPLLASWVQRLQSASPTSGDGFGSNFAIDGDRLLIAAPYAGTVPYSTALADGAIYPYYQAGGSWAELQPGSSGATVPVGTTGVDVGRSIALSGLYFAAGLSGHYMVWTYRYLDPMPARGWRYTQMASAYPDQLSDPGGFGDSLDLLGDLIIIGAPRYTGNVGGQAYIFRLGPDGAWNREKLLGGTGYGGTFGSRVALSRANAFVASDDPTGATQIGVYEQVGQDWLRVGGIAIPSDGTLSGAQGHTVVSLRPAELHVSQYDGAAWQTKRLAGSLASNPRVSMSGNLLAVTAVDSVRVYQRWGDTWSLAATVARTDLPTSIGASRDWTFGVNTAIDGRRLLTTSYSGNSLREVHYFELTTDGINGSPCQANADCASGACVDHVCCDRSCRPCESCKAVEKASGDDGFCGPVKRGLDPDGYCSNQGPESCGQNGVCDGLGGCALYPSGVDCGKECRGQLSVQRQCNGSGQCVGVAVLADCAPRVCIAGACAPCTLHTDCPQGSRCAAGQCVGLLATGQRCTSNAECASTFCVDGVCCDSACSGSCESCRGAYSIAGTDGVCASVQAGQDPDDNCATTEAASCGTDGTCDGQGGCRFHPSGTFCATSCLGTQVVVHRCDGLGGCQVGSEQNECLPSICRDGMCTTCNVNGDCPSGALCQNGACVTPGELGASCTDLTQCNSRFCVDGVCCSTACGANCMACTAALKGTGTDGTCGLARAGIDPHNNCTDLGALACSTDGQCDGAGNCRLYPMGTACGLTTCNGNSLAGQICDGSGQCKSTTGVDCTPYVCRNSACLTGCTSGTDCQSGLVCLGGACGSPGTGGAGTGGASTGGMATGGALTGGATAVTGGTSAGSGNQAGSGTGPEPGDCTCRTVTTRPAPSLFGWWLLPGLWFVIRRRRSPRRRVPI